MGDQEMRKMEFNNHDLMNVYLMCHCSDICYNVK